MGSTWMLAVFGNSRVAGTPPHLNVLGISSSVTLSMVGKVKRGIDSELPCRSCRKARVQSVTMCCNDETSIPKREHSSGDTVFEDAGHPSFSAQRFEVMYDRLRRWKAMYYTTIVPGTVADAKELSQWCSIMRRLHRKKLLPSWAVAKLDELGMDWKVDVVTAKWYANFHAAKEFKEINGGVNCDINVQLPSEYWNEERPDWVEASRWLERQRDLYRRQKLTMARVRLLKDILGEWDGFLLASLLLFFTGKTVYKGTKCHYKHAGVKLVRPYSKKRRNMHPFLKEANARFAQEYGL